MERQQLLETSERGVVFSGDKRAPRDSAPRLPLREPHPHNQDSHRHTQDRYESRTFITVLTEMFGRKHRNTHSFVCDVLVASLLVFSFILVMDCSCGLVLVEASPVITEKQLSTFHLIPSARNIRHLPCISRRTKEEGVCMFAIDCLKANGTHLGTCIDRFYFGSCCKIPDYIDSISDNHIEDNTIYQHPIRKPLEPVKNDVSSVSVSPTTLLTIKPTVALKTPSTSGVLSTSGTTSTFGTSHYITKKPSPTFSQTSVKHTSYATTKKTIEPALDRTEITERPQILPVMKPLRLNFTTTTATNYHSTLLATHPTKQPNVTTSSTIQSTIYINNQLYNASKPAFVNNQKLSSKPEMVTTDIPVKISTFQTVQGNQDGTKATTQKYTTINTVTKKPIVPQKPETQLPFGTRLPSTTQKSTTVYVKPTYTRLNQTTRPASTYSTVPQKPIKPTTALKPIPEKPINATKPNPTQRPIVQRPINSTLSNRRPTTAKPTTVFNKKPISTSESTTHKTTTIIYKPFTGSSKPPSSQKPISKPNPTSSKTTTAKPTKASTTTDKPTTIKITTTKTPPRIATNTTTQSFNATTTKPTTKKPATTATKPIQKPTVVYFNNTTKYPSTTTSKKPISTQKPTVATKKPVLKPTVQSTLKPSISLKPETTTVNPLTNEVDGPIVLKTTVEAQKPVTTEKIGLVTWSSYNDPPVTPSGIANTTKVEGWSPATPVGGWVLISTVSPTVDNLTTVLTSTSKKPVATNITSKPTTTFVSLSSTILNATTSRPLTKVPDVTKPIFTVEVSTGYDNESFSENSTTTPLDEMEFSTFMYVSSNPTESSVSINGSTTLGVNSTTVFNKLNETKVENGTTVSSTDVMNNGTLSPDELLSTEKSTVSPIEGITSTGTPVVSNSQFNMSDFTEVCGRRLWPEARIVGGAKASFGMWPWQISLRQWRTSTYLHKCGAALLNENWAITAAHCVDSVPPSDLLLRLGEHDLISEEEPYGFQERRVQIVASHPQFDPRTFEYDLALLRFYEPVTFQPNILPVCVPTNDEGFVGKTAYVTGWGRLYEDGPLPNVLQQVSVPVIENAQCESMYRNAGYIEHIPHIFICAGWEKGGMDSCEGDSGGPMVLQRDDDRFLLAGVISWGIGCAEPNQPGVYTRISQFRNWINQILQF